MAFKNTDYSVIFADEQLVVLNKRSGLLIASDRYNPDLPRLDEIAQKEFGKLYAVHRIDKDTSGLILYARNLDAMKQLSLQFESRQVHKIYHALIYGHPLWKTLSVDLPLLPDGDSRHRTIPDRKNGKKSITDFTLLENLGAFSLIEARPITGRTHQIRAHLAANSLFIVCDPLYGKKNAPIKLSDLKRNWRGNQEEERPLLSRLALHAKQIEFTHPLTQKKLCLQAPYPKDLEATLKQLRKL